MFYVIMIGLFLIVPPFTGMCSDDNAAEKSEATPSFQFQNMTKDIPDYLAEKIKLYWQNQGSNKLDSAYEMEAPHTKYQVSFKNYPSFYAKARKLYGCKILGLTSKNNDGLFVVRIKILFDDKEKNSSSEVINDKWIKLDSNWYHVYINPFASIW